MANQLYPALQQYIAERELEFHQISDERKVLLERLSAYVNYMLKEREVSLLFICTHNSRRSHMAQIWAYVAAHYHGIDGVKAFSAGTETTEFNGNAIASLERAGLVIRKIAPKGMGYHLVDFADHPEALVCFSKTIDHHHNPTSNFAAIMTCSEADEACPNVSGADFRIALKYEDPKISDGTPEQEKTYDERCAEIAREMLYLFSKLE